MVTPMEMLAAKERAEQEKNGHGEIYGLMAKVLSEVGAIGKNRRNEQQGYAFRGVDDVYAAVHPLFAKHGIFTLPRVLSEETAERITEKGTVLRFVKLTVAYDFFAPDGSHVTAEVVGEAMDSGDKASNKAMSAAQKYAIIQTFCIPTGATPDADYSTPDELQPAARPASKSSTAKEACPKCGRDMWDNRDSKRNPKAPDYKCKNKSCDGTIWLDTGKTDSEQTLRDELFNQAERLLIALGKDEDKRKAALGRLVALPTDQMQIKVNELADGASHARTSGKIDEVKANLIALIEGDYTAERIEKGLKAFYAGASLDSLSVDQLKELHQELIPF